MVHQHLDGSVGIAIHSRIHDRLVLIQFIAARIGDANGELAIPIGKIVELLAIGHQPPGTTGADQGKVKGAVQDFAVRVNCIGNPIGGARRL